MAVVVYTQYNAKAITCIMLIHFETSEITFRTFNIWMKSRIQNPLRSTPMNYFSNRKENTIYFDTQSYKLQ
jgi:hypothetical protein